MNSAEALTLEFDADAAGDDAFRVQLSDYDGPLDLLLEMARGQKLDLAKISILGLADQYIAYIENAKALRLEIAADYLVMAAWLTYLKSRLLLPKQEQPKDEPTAAQMADALAFQLRRLEAMKNATRQLFQRPQKGQQFFTRGAPEGLMTLTDKIFTDTLYDLLSAYAAHTARQEQQGAYHPHTPHVLVTLEEAIERISAWFGARGLWRSRAWVSLNELLTPAENPTDMTSITGRSYLAALFSASLEMAKTGQIVIQQHQNFGPIYLRAHVETAEETPHESATA